MTTIVSSDWSGEFDWWSAGSDRLEAAQIRTIYEHYRPMLERYAQRNGAADPEGVADLSFFDGLRAVERLKSKTERSFRSYIFRAAASHIASEKRRGKLQLSSLDEHEAACPLPDLDELVVEASSMSSLLETLSADQRQVIHDRFFIGYSSVETAGRLGKSPGAVRKLQHDAIAKLRKAAYLLGMTAVIAVVVVGAAMLGGSSGVSIETPADRAPESNRVGFVPAVSDWEADPEPGYDRPHPQQKTGAVDDRSTPETTDGWSRPAEVENEHPPPAGRSDTSAALPSDDGGEIDIPPVSVATPAPPTTAGLSAPSTTAGLSAPSTTAGLSAPSTTARPSATTPPSTLGIGHTTVSRPIQPAAPIPSPAAPRECEIDSKKLEVEQSDGLFAPAYHFFDKKRNLVHTSDELIESKQQEDQSEKVWRAEDNRGFRPTSAKYVAAVSSNGQRSPFVSCRREQAGNDHDGGDRNNDRNNDSGDDDSGDDEDDDD